MAGSSVTRKFVGAFEYAFHSCSCGVEFAITNGFDERLRKSGAQFYCPKGCSLYYVVGPSEADRLRQQLESTNKNLQVQKERIEFFQRELAKKERQRRAQKGRLTRLMRKEGASL